MKSKMVPFLLLALFILALSTRTYTVWRQGFDDDPVQHPDTIMAGKSLAPHQYRVLYPLMWAGLSRVLDGGQADKALLFLTIVGCYAVMLFAYHKLMRSLPLACLGLLAFLGACMHPYQFQFRDTFLEVGLVSLAFYLQTRADRSPGVWNWLALISVAGTLNRETWIFVVSGCFLAQCHRSVRALWTTPEGRTAVAGVVKMGAATVLTVLASRLVWGMVPLYCDLWTWRENLPHILFWTYPAITIGHGIWGVGAGVFLVYLLTLLDGNRHQRLFIAGYLLPLLVVSFITVARWIESRTFFPAFAVIVAAIGMHIRQAFPPEDVCPDPPAGAAPPAS